MSDIFSICKIQTQFVVWYLVHFLQNCHQVNASGPLWCCCDIDSGGFFVSCGNKSLPYWMLMKFCEAICFNRYQQFCSLTYWGRDKMAAISQTAFSNTFSWMKICGFRLLFHWVLFLSVKKSISHHWFRKWLGANKATSHYMNQWW